MFALNHPLSADSWSKLGVMSEHVYDPRVKRHVRTDPHQILYPCFRVVPMGWNWALFLCNEAVLNIARSITPWDEGILREKKVVPHVTEFRTIMGVYVDNITILGKYFDDVLQRRQILQEAFDKAGIPITWSQDTPVSKLESVGCLLDLERGILLNKPSRVWKFVRATSALLRRRKLRGEMLQVCFVRDNPPWFIRVGTHIPFYSEVHWQKNVCVELSAARNQDGWFCCLADMEITCGAHHEECRDRRFFYLWICAYGVTASDQHDP